MFERQVAELLRAYLGEYIEGLDNESLNIRVWKGARHAAPYVCATHPVWAFARA